MKNSPSGSGRGWSPPNVGAPSPATAFNFNLYGTGLQVVVEGRAPAEPASDARLRALLARSACCSIVNPFGLAQVAGMTVHTRHSCRTKDFGGNAGEPGSRGLLYLLCNRLPGIAARCSCSPRSIEPMNRAQGQQ
jgi:hypothetical protein